MAIPRVLIIAGSDSSGGAGLEADQKVLAAHKCYAMTATTALTAQNTLGVEDVHVTPPAFVAKQIDAVLSDIGCDVVKIGMLASAETISVVAKALKEHKVERIVLDPVMVATSGAQLLPGDAVGNFREHLLPITTILTPNIPEATLLLRDADIQFKSPSSLEDLKSLAKMVYELGPKAVLLKGGHMPLNKSYMKASSDADRHITVNVLYDGKDCTVIESPYLNSRNTHGTGCSLASAIAANLAFSPSQPLATTVRKSVHYVAAGISSASSSSSPSSSPSSSSTTTTTTTTYLTTKGAGPINHFHSLFPLPFSPGHFIDSYLLTHPLVLKSWHAYTHHPFPHAMSRGTLPETSFKNYLVQDYLYLTHFARTHALAAYKSSTMDSIATSASIISHIQTEMNLHLTYCLDDFSITRSEIESTPESLACTAYSRYVLDVGMSQDWLALQISLAPCLLGYGIVAERLFGDPGSVKNDQGNRYWKWFENYVAEDYRAAVKTGRELIERAIVKCSSHRVEELVKIFVRATEMEVQFWEEGAHTPVGG